MLKILPCIFSNSSCSSRAFATTICGITTSSCAEKNLFTCTLQRAADPCRVIT
ncbi:MAG: hypothetical protein LKF96_05610 [Treponema sp.]|nr:hypothetical protein [Treponema sp.]